MLLKTIKILLCIIAVLAVACPVYGYEIETRYATITYDDRGALKQFNRKLHLGRLKYHLKGKANDTLEDEVRNKIDLVVDRVKSILDMYPKQLKFSIVIHKSPSGVRADFLRIYNLKVDYIAFFSPLENTVFFSSKRANLRVVAHEIGHVVAENYFAISPPTKIHEVLAQYAEMHITD